MGHRSTLLLLPMLLLAALFATLPVGPAPVAQAAGFVTFEDGADGAPIRSNIAGLAFTNTAGYDWAYGDWRTGRYNGRYPAGAYTSNGDFFAWLGPRQGYGKITFTQSDATYLQLWVSADEPVTLEGYTPEGVRVAQTFLGAANTRTGRMGQLRIEAPAGQRLGYAYIFGTANRWLIDDLATDAGGVPDTRTPLVLLPGIMGTELHNSAGLIWPDTWRIVRSPGDEHLRVLRLAADGESPASDDEAFASVRIGDIVRNDGRSDVYAPLITYLTQQRGYAECPDIRAACPRGTLFVFPYDWRKNLGAAADQLDARVDAILAATGAPRVNLLAHSMGGLVARAYLSDPVRARKVNIVLTLGTPYLGAPKSYQALHYGTCQAPPTPVGCWLNREMTYALVQNFPGSYALVPPEAYFRARPDGHVRRDYDGDSDGVIDGWLSSEAISRTMRTKHNTYLTAQAAEFHRPIPGYAGWRGPAQVFAVVGYGHGETPDGVREYLEAGRDGKPELRFEILRADGDGTVPLVSASMGREGGQTDLSGGVPLYYVQGEHGELPKIGSVQRLAADLFETRGESAGHREPDIAAVSAPAGGEGEPLLRTERASAPATASEPWRPITPSPEALNGRWVQLSGDVMVEITDGVGVTMRVGADGPGDLSLPGVGAYRLGDVTAIFLPASGGYTVRAAGGAATELDLRASTVRGNVDQVTVAYANVGLGAGGSASLSLPEVGVADAPLAVDRDGDGLAEAQVPPVGVLDEADGADRTPPASEAALKGRLTARGWYEGPVEVTLSASDGREGSGVARIEYSLDGGRSYTSYSEPFVVDASRAGRLLVRATDRAGNEQYPLTAVQVGPERVALPLLGR